MKTHTELSDQELINLYNSGNIKALNDLIIRHKDKIYTSVYLLVKDSNVADDIFQELFIKIIDAIKTGRYNDNGRFLNWALRISHNLCIDHFRSIKRSPVLNNREDADPFESVIISEYGIEEKIINYEIHNDIRNLLNQLPEDQREVIVLRHYADLSFKEIAGLTNCSINTALGRMRYGLTNLRKLKRNHHLV
jgi:RNA polymerase sigma-70 factor (ECF subfamily)